MLPSKVQLPEDAELSAVRHGHSAFQEMQDRLNGDPLYQWFERSYEHDPESTQTVRVAREVYRAYRFGIAEGEIPLSGKGWKQVGSGGKRLCRTISYPHFALCSPFLRTRQSFKGLARGWSELDHRTAFFPEPLLREQSHGIVNEYPNWKVFLAMHPQERRNKERLGWGYSYPNGESVWDLYRRIQTLVRVRLPLIGAARTLIVSSQFPITMLRVVLCGGGLDEFDRINREEKLENAALCVFKSRSGVSGATLIHWNLKLYDEAAGAAA